ncbi:MAG: site-specific recombinase [Frankiales bacterium]|nr:site-specific recombinase [Frankiales bacterium]
MRAAVYARISRDRTGEAVGSARQLTLCRELAASQGWDVVWEGTDNDISAFSGRPRPQYEQLLLLMTEGGIDVVIAYHPDRLHRRSRELSRFIDVCQASRHASLRTLQRYVRPSHEAVARLTAEHDPARRHGRSN